MKLKIIAACILTSNLIFAQATLEEAKKYIDVPGGVQNIDKKVLKEPDPQYMPYMALKFRTATSKSAANGNGDNRVTATAYAMLDGMDSTIFQEITNEFYKSFIDKLKTAGVTFLDFEKIKTSKLYQKLSAEVEDRHYNNKNTGTSDVFTQNYVPFFRYPANAMKIAKMSNELEACLSTLRITINFVEFDLDLKKAYGYNTVTTSANADAQAVIKIESIFAESLSEGVTMGGGFTMSNKKYFSALFAGKQPIYEPFKATITPYDDKLPKYANRKFRMFGGGMQLGTFVVEVDPQDYKKAALTALNRYADYIVATIKSYNTK